MNDQSLKLPKFYITAPTPCPYLKDKMERKVFTALSGPDPARRHEALSHMGFRRSQNIVYRPACEDCKKCISVPYASFEQFDLLKSYLTARHAGGGMAEMDEFEFSEMIESSPVMTRLIEYREQRPEPEGAKHRSGSLAGVALTDIMSDGLSLVYSFFKTDKAASGLGTFIILDHIQKARAAGLSYLYLGYWVKDSKTMAYKARFQPLELLSDDDWVNFPKH